MEKIPSLIINEAGFFEAPRHGEASTQVLAPSFSTASSNLQAIAIVLHQLRIWIEVEMMSKAGVIWCLSRIGISKSGCFTNNGDVFAGF